MHVYLAINGNAGRHGITFVLVYFRLFLAAVGLLGIPSFCVKKLCEHLKIVICTGDGCALLKGFCMVFWTHVNGVQHYVSVGKVNLVRRCRLNAYREDCLCDRQVVGFGSVCKLQWDDFFKGFCFLWMPSCIMAQMRRDSMWCRYILGVCLIMKSLVCAICVSLRFC